MVQNLVETLFLLMIPIAFEQELTEELSARSSESEAHCHPTLTLCTLREKKIGDIRAGNAEDEQSNGGESGEEELDAHLATRRERSGGFDTEAVVLVGFGMRLTEALGDDAKFLRSLRLRDAGPEARGNANPLGVARLFLRGISSEFGEIAKGNPELRIKDYVETVEGGRRATPTTV
jgi:hypothetical protein